MTPLAETAVAPLYRGLRRLKNRALNRIDPPLVVLTYHRVARPAEDPHRIAVSPENFRAQLAYLADHCRCVRLEDDWRTMARPAVALTFDDGYADNLHQALPLLEEAGIPATFFICTGLLGDRAGFWSDQLARLLLGEGARPPQLVLADNRFGGCWPSAAAGQRRVLHDRLHRAMLTLGPERREEWLIQLRRWAGSDGAAPAADRPLTPEELRRLASSPLVTIGAHGVTHTPLAVLSAAAQRDEIDGSRQALAALLGREPTLFAYPFGGKGEFDATTRRLCRESGFRRAVTTFPGQAHRWSDPLLLPRQLVRDWDAAAFAERLREFWS